MALLAFDIDGTLLDVDEGTDYESPESVRKGARTNDESAERVRVLASKGHRFAYVTGRCGHLRPVTLVQLSKAVPMGPLHMQRAWEGYAKMAEWKGAVLVKLEAAVYVGDHAADREAARIAGIPFVHVDDFRAGVWPGV